MFPQAIHFSIISQETDTCGHIRPAEVTQMAFLGDDFEVL